MRRDDITAVSFDFFNTLVRHRDRGRGEALWLTPDYVESGNPGVVRRLSDVCEYVCGG